MGVDTTPGYWRHTATVDWCEANYAVTPYIAEFANTMSSLFLVAAGLLPIGTWFFAKNLELRYLVLHVLTATVGVGSFLFHATLMRETQFADEGPMIWNGMALAYVIFMVNARKGEDRGHLAWSIPALLVVYSICVTAAMVFFPESPLLFQNSYLLVVIAIITLSVKRYMESTNRVAKFSCVLSLQSYLFVSIFWVLERQFCDWNRAIVGGSFHAIWHIGAAAGLFFNGLFWSLERLDVVYNKAGKAEIHYVSGVPYADIKVAP